MRSRSILFTVIAFCTLTLSVGAVDAKPGPLVFDKIVILSGGSLDSPITIADPAELAGSELDSIRPREPSPKELGTPYQLQLYPAGVPEEAFIVTYYAPKDGTAGYMELSTQVNVGGGTIDAGWSQPSPELQTALNNRRVVHLSDAHGGWLSGGESVALAVVGLLALFIAIGAAYIASRRRRNSRGSLAKYAS